MRIRSGPMAIFVVVLAMAACPAFAGGASTQPAGVQSGAGGEQQITEQVIVNAPRSAVWRAFTTADGARTFFAPDAHIELKLNGAYEIYFVPKAKKGQRGSEGCRILSFVPEQMLSFTWNAPPKFGDLRGMRTFVVIEFAEEGPETTRVTLRHLGWRDDGRLDKVFAYFRQAWPHVLGNLKKRFAEGPLEWGESSKAAEARANTPAKQYVYFIQPVRPGLIEGTTPEEDRILSGHVEHIKSLKADGRLVLAGPCFDPPYYPDEAGAVPLEMPTPGIVVFEADSLEEARAVMEQDPAVAGGVFKARLNEMRIAFRRE